MVNQARKRGAAGPVMIEIQRLKQLSIPALRAEYRRVCGEETQVLHKPFLIRRIAWQWQARARGGLSERALERIRELSNANVVPVSTKPVIATSLTSDPRLPPPGSFLSRRYQGREIVVKVGERDFEFEGKRFRSLSAVARSVTGTRWNGFLFFQLAERAS